MNNNWQHSTDESNRTYGSDRTNKPVGTSEPGEIKETDMTKSEIYNTIEKTSSVKLETSNNYTNNMQRRLAMPERPENQLQILNGNECNHQQSSQSLEGNSFATNDTSVVTSCPSTFRDWVVIDDVTNDEETVQHSQADESDWINVLGRHRVNRQHGPYHSSPKPSRLSAGYHTRSKQKKHAIIGNGPRSFVEAVPRHSGNRQCTGLFVTRLKPQTSTTRLALCVLRECSIVIHPEKMPQRNPNYSSFYIRCNHHIRQQLLNSYIWPAGAEVRPFYN